MRPDLSVIVVTHGRPDLALATLRSAHAAAATLEVEWLVVDSGSTDETPDLIEREFPHVELVRDQNIGFAAANNRVLTRARGRYVLLLNPDVEIASGTFAELIELLQARPRVGIASVIQQDSDAELMLSMRSYPSAARAFGEALALPWRGVREEEERRSRYDEECSVDWLVGAFLLARAEAVRDIGGLDERFFLYSEEIDWCYRARAAGWDVCHLPQMTITHHTTASTKPDLVAQLSYAKLLFARKHYTRPQVAAIAAALATRHLLRILMLSVKSIGQPELRQRLRAERHALKVIAGLAPLPFRRDPALEHSDAGSSDAGSSDAGSPNVGESLAA
ncbi:MAG TPA: glycosyltransferase family 2 protein [Solirubrobacteraceae bacterium]|nr:glycosyltransferase family 2 protein [Solirubrobacteraceae bacterium]